MAFAEKTQKVIDSREKCPRCGNKVRLIHFCVPFERYEMRCWPCQQTWMLKTPVEQKQGAFMISDRTVIACLTEWNEIAAKERMKYNDQRTEDPKNG